MRYTSEHDMPMWSAPYDRPERSYEPDPDVEYERLRESIDTQDRYDALMLAGQIEIEFAITPAQVVMLGAELSERRPA